MKVGIDLMGGDTPPKELLAGVLTFLSFLPSQVTFTLFGNDLIFEPFKKTLNECSDRVRVVHSAEVVEMQDSPRAAFRNKRNASLFLALESLQKDEIEALITTANTGALLLGCLHFIPKIKDIRRPALLTEIPTTRHPVVLTDVGANVSLSEDGLLDCALLGVEHQWLKHGILNPTVALLNIGTEPYKGPMVLKKAYQLFSHEKRFHFLGNIESDQALTAKADVIVADGFTGNIFLKTVEAAFQFFLDQLEPNYREKFASILDNVAPGAVVAGITKTVIKCHGAARPAVLIKAIQAVTFGLGK